MSTTCLHQNSHFWFTIGISAPMPPLSSLWILHLLTPTDSFVSFIQAHDFSTSWMLIIPIYLCIALIYLSRSVPLLQLQPHIFYWTKYISFVGTPSSWALGWKHFHTLNTSLSLDWRHVISIHSAFITALTTISSSFFSPPLSYFRPLWVLIWNTGEGSKLSLFLSLHILFYTCWQNLLTP